MKLMVILIGRVQIFSPINISLSANIKQLCSSSELICNQHLVYQDAFSIKVGTAIYFGVAIFQQSKHDDYRDYNGMNTTLSRPSKRRDPGIQDPGHFL